MVRALVAALATLCCATPAYAATLMVDDDGAASIESCDGVAPAFASVVGAMSVARGGDSVLVCPGVYVGPIVIEQFVSLRSVAGPTVTVLDGNALDSVVTIRASVLVEGFTIRNGRADYGGGVRVSSFEPTVRGNVIAGNTACAGFGVALVSGTLERNTIAHNVARDCGGGLTVGGGVLVSLGLATVRENTIVDNGSASIGGGIGAMGEAIIERNVISGNHAHEGGGIALTPTAFNSVVAGNLIVGNFALLGGGGIHWRFGPIQYWPRVLNNTVVVNESPQGSAVFADGFDGSLLVSNNILVGARGRSAVFCGDFQGDRNPPQFSHNNVFSPTGTRFAGFCTDQTGTAGNISADPLFVNPAAGNYRLRMSSPNVDAGDSGSPMLPLTDLDGDGRTFDGDFNGVATVDIGAQELWIHRHVQLDSPRLGAPLQPFAVAGWAVDSSWTDDGTGVDAVHVWAHPKNGSAAIFLGAADYGLPRDDVAAALRDPRYRNSGFRLAGSVSLPDGEYLLVAYAHHPATNTFELTGSKSLTIGSGLRMVVDVPGAGEIVRGPILRLSGWAVDTSSVAGAGIDAIHAYAYDDRGGPAIFLGAAILEAVRPDVAEAFGSAEFTRSGWWLEAALPQGNYTIALHVRSAVTGQFMLGSTRRVTMLGSVPKGAIESPGPGDQPFAHFIVSGWAADIGALVVTGMDAIHVYVFPNPGSGAAPRFLGEAFYGHPREDVANRFGVQFQNCGYSLSAGAQPAGDYLLVVYARSTMTGTFTAIDSRPIRIPRR